MKVQTLFLSLWFTIQGDSEGSTMSTMSSTCLPACPPCQYRCIIDCNRHDCLGASCEGDRGCHEQCPPGTKPDLFSQNSSKYLCIIVGPNNK